MQILAGDRLSFAVEMEITTDKWRNKTAIWLDGTRIGDWDDENLLAPFLNSLQRVAEEFADLWDDELTGLDCRQMFLTIVPCYFDPDSFYDLSPAEQEHMLKFDKFIFHWGENFDSWVLRSVYNNGVCKFLWAHNKTQHDIHCHDVRLEEIQKVYGELAIYHSFHD